MKKQYIYPETSVSLIGMVSSLLNVSADGRIDKTAIPTDDQW